MTDRPALRTAGIPVRADPLASFQVIIELIDARTLTEIFRRGISEPGSRSASCGLFKPLPVFTVGHPEVQFLHMRDELHLRRVCSDEPNWPGATPLKSLALESTSPWHLTRRKRNVQFSKIGVGNINPRGNGPLLRMRNRHRRRRVRRKVDDRHRKQTDQPAAGFPHPDHAQRSDAPRQTSREPGRRRRPWPAKLPKRSKKRGRTLPTLPRNTLIAPVLPREATWATSPRARWCPPSPKRRRHSRSARSAIR